MPSMTSPAPSSQLTYSLGRERHGADTDIFAVIGIRTQRHFLQEAIQSAAQLCVETRLGEAAASIGRQPGVARQAGKIAARDDSVVCRAHNLSRVAGIDIEARRRWRRVVRSIERAAAAAAGGNENEGD
jgi:hypothetical protein